MKNKKREVYIDILRILACIMVIFNHTNERGFYKILTLTGRPYIWRSFFSILCKCAVPIFFMISGALLLKKEESIKDTYKRIPKILIDLILFSLIYIYIDSILILSTSYWHLWYLYAYIAFIITLPFMRKFAKSLDFKTSIYLLVLSLLTMGINPIVNNYLIKLNNNLLPYWTLTNIFIYPIIGYILENIIDIKKIKLKHIIGIWIILIISIIIGEVCEHYFLLKYPASKDETFLTNFSLLHALTFFVTIKYFVKGIHINKLCYSIITETGKNVFGIYLIHILFLCKIPFFNNIWTNLEQGVIGVHIGVFITCILVFLICNLIIYILRKIPLIKKLL